MMFLNLITLLIQEQLLQIPSAMSTIDRLSSIIEFKKKNNYLKKKITPTMVQICSLENIEHKNIKQVSYSGKYSLLASRAHQSHLQFSFVVRMLSLR